MKDSRVIRWEKGRKKTTSRIYTLDKNLINVSFLYKNRKIVKHKRPRDFPQPNYILLKYNVQMLR